MRRGETLTNNILGWKAGALAAVMGLSVLSGGCAPRLLQDYAVRTNEVVFVVQEGSSYSLGDCKRATDGTLSDCKLHEVEFE
jgi:hypothetical protein